MRPRQALIHSNTITITSACNLVFRSRYLEPNTIGIIHPQGYRSNDRQSVKALYWLKWVSHQTGQYIRHAANNGEVHVGKYKVDGYYEADGVKTVLEFNGCLHQFCGTGSTRVTVMKTAVEF